MHLASPHLLSKQLLTCCNLLRFSYHWQLKHQQHQPDTSLSSSQRPPCTSPYRLTLLSLAAYNSHTLSAAEVGLMLVTYAAHRYIIHSHSSHRSKVQQLRAPALCNATNTLLTPAGEHVGCHYRPASRVACRSLMRCRYAIFLAVRPTTG